MDLLHVYEDAYSPPNGTCIAPDCNNFWSLLQESLGNQVNPNDCCYKWARFVCGHHFARHQGDDGPVVVIEGVVQKLFETVHSMIDPSYQSETSSPGVKITSSTGNYSDKDIALLESIFSKELSADKSAAIPTSRHDALRNSAAADGDTMANGTIHAPSSNSFTEDRPWTTAAPNGNTTFNATLPPGPRPADLWTMVHSYFDTCMNARDPETSYAVLLDLMEEVRRPFNALDHMSVFTHGDQQDTWRRTADATRPVDVIDAQGANRAMLNLGRYGIFPLFKFGVGVSYKDHTRTGPIVAPHPRTGLDDPDLYKLPSILKRYERMLDIVLPKLHGPWAPTVQDMYKLSMNIINLEKALHTVLPSDKQWRDMRHSVESVTLEELNRTNPLRLDGILLTMAHGEEEKIATVDVLFQDSLRKYWQVLRGFSRETLRTYMMWQAFLQTEELWDMSWAKEWRAFKHAHSPVLEPSPRWDEHCVGRVQRHFGHFVGAQLMRDVFAQEDGKDAVFEVGRITARVGHALGCPHHMSSGCLSQIYREAHVHADSPGMAPGQDQTHGRASSLNRPEKWSHLHDWFALEQLHWTRSWEDLGQPLDRNKCLNLGMSFKVTV
ncbi:Peptidase M13 [Metarhizium album ARSEF 1941]|uniref:Peptidase M13 n=1 Tax=Metarhizium album (strain ARSEF 1941) TaxID=1081103 RepID=A0A0B2X690_METAS|nr:Peptidase M13 [Metarhizium album ARSEF 1941]KHO01904.1 Peptidase M13 [Metarhizium album ARSEF 1941]